MKVKSLPLFIFFLIFGLALNSLVSSPKSTMVWLCLEICDNKTRIAQQIEVIRHHAKNSLTDVSFEKYTLSTNAELVLYPRLSEVNHILKNITAFGGKKLKTFPMITSHPYPDDFILRMRKLFANPTPFIESAVKNLQQNGYEGYNLDFEPKRPGIVPDDAIKYCEFITKFANRLHSINKTLQVDVAQWTPLWNYTLLGKTTADDIITMSTYAGNFTVFQGALRKAVREVGVQKLQAGLMIVHPQTNKGYTKEEIDMRFKDIIAHKVKGISVWRMHPEIGMTSYWWNALEKFLKN